MSALDDARTTLVRAAGATDEEAALAEILAAARQSPAVRWELGRLLLTDTGDFLRTGGALSGPLAIRALTLLDDEPGPGSLVGQRIGALRIESVLGRGGMGLVYRAVDEALGRPVALKTISGANGEDPGRRERLRREARILSQLDHPNVCRIYGLLEHDGNDLLVLELVEGESLRERLRRPVERAEALRWGRDLCSALAAAHQRGIVHRDLKPENVVLGPHGAIKVLDFGIARLLGEDWRPEPTGNRPGEESYRTAVGTLVGTLAYMSPEQCRGEATGEPSDLYSCGLLLQELVTGAPAYDLRGLSQVARIERIRRGETAAFTSGDRELDALVRSLTAFAPNHRPTAQQAVAHLEHLLGRAARRRLRWRVGGVVAATAAVALAAIGVLQLRAADALREAQRIERLATATEWRLRAAALAPAHDVTATFTAVRAEADELAARAVALPRAARAEADRSLGRIALALGDLEVARERLTRAIAGGADDADAHAGLGLALAALYERELAALVAVGRPEQRELARRRAEETLREPALAALARADGATVAPAALVRARVALLEGDLDQATAQARLAYTGRPWLFEALELEAEVARRNAERLAAASAGAEAVLAAYDASLAAYERAAAVGRSATSVLGEACLTHSLRQLARGNLTGAVIGEAAAEAATAACARARAVDPDNVTARIGAARFETQRLAAGGDPRAIAEGAARLAGDLDEALRRHPHERRLLATRGALWTWAAQSQAATGVDTRNAGRRAVDDFRALLAHHPGDPLAPFRLANALFQMAIGQATAGEDPDAAIAEAIALSRRAQEQFPDEPSYRAQVALQLALQGRVALGRGAPCATSFEAARAELLALVDSGATQLLFEVSAVEAMLGECRLEHGGDAREALDSARARAESLGPELAWRQPVKLVGDAWFHLARLAARDGRSPRAELDQAAARYADLVTAAPAHLDGWCGLAEIEANRAELHPPESAAARAALDRAHAAVERAAALGADQVEVASARGVVLAVAARAEAADPQRERETLLAAEAALAKAASGFPPPRIRQRLAAVRQRLAELDAAAGAPRVRG